MQNPDMINGLFEFISGILSWINVRQLYKDKEVRGYNIKVFSFFVLWGYWNLYYYPNLHQWISFFGGMSITLASTTWLILAIYYKNKEMK